MGRDSKGLYKEGHTGNPKGRAGSPNRITKMTRGSMHKLFEDYWPKVREDMDAVSPKERLDFIAKILPYLMPRLAMIKGDLDIKGTGAENLTSAELTQFILEVSKPKRDDDSDSTLPI